MIDTNGGQRHYFLYPPTNKSVLIVNVRDLEKKKKTVKNRKRKTRKQEANTECIIRENYLTFGASPKPSYEKQDKSPLLYQPPLP